MKTILFLIAMVTGCYYAMPNNQQYPTIINEQFPDELIAIAENKLSTLKQEVEIEKINSEIIVYNLRQKELAKLKHEIDNRINVFFNLVDSLRVYSNSIAVIDSFYKSKPNSFNYKFLVLNSEEKTEDNLYLKQNLEMELLFQKKERNVAYQVMLAENSMALFYHQVELNKLKISELLKTFNQLHTIKITIEKLDEEVRVLYNSIVWLQEEAHAQPNQSAILGGLNNAQEKTTFVLAKQQKIIEYLSINQKKPEDKNLKGNSLCFGIHGN